MSVSNEFYEEPQKAEPKDRTLWLWLGLIVVVAAMLAVLWYATRASADVTHVRAKHILIRFNKEDPAERAQALEQITRLREQILNGANFNKIAKDYSNDETSSARGGDLGYYGRGTFEPEFEKCVWSIPVGEVSDIVQTTYGYHIIVVTDRHVSKTDQYEMDLEKKALDAKKNKPEQK